MRALALSPGTMGDKYEQIASRVLGTRPFAKDSSRRQETGETMYCCMPACLFQVSYHTTFDSLAKWEA